MKQVINRLKKDGGTAKAAFTAIVLVFSVAALLTYKSHAQLTGGTPFSILTPQTLVAGGFNGWTNALQGTLAASNTVVPVLGNQVIDASRALEHIQLQFLGQSSGADTATKNIVLARNVDGSTNWEVFLNWQVTGNGATYVTACTNLSNFSLGGMPSRMTVLYITNNSAGGTYLTNYSVKFNLL